MIGPVKIPSPCLRERNCANKFAGPVKLMSTTLIFLRRYNIISNIFQQLVMTPFKFLTSRSSGEGPGEGIQERVLLWFFPSPNPSRCCGRGINF
jgi:hypothetical protein